jgi:hypothetical protein
MICEREIYIDIYILICVEDTHDATRCGHLFGQAQLDPVVGPWTTTRPRPWLLSRPIRLWRSLLSHPPSQSHLPGWHQRNAVPSMSRLQGNTSRDPLPMPLPSVLFLSDLLGLPIRLRTSVVRGLALCKKNMHMYKPERNVKRYVIYGKVSAAWIVFTYIHVFNLCVVKFTEVKQSSVLVYGKHVSTTLEMFCFWCSFASTAWFMQAVLWTSAIFIPIQCILEHVWSVECILNSMYVYKKGKPTMMFNYIDLSYFLLWVFNPTYRDRKV